MRPEPRSNEQLLAWVAQIIRYEQERKTNGEIRVQLHEGVIQRAKIESTETPPK